MDTSPGDYSLTVTRIRTLNPLEQRQRSAVAGLEGAALEVVDLEGRIDAEGMEDRGLEIGRAAGILDGLGAERVGATVDPAALDPAPREGHRIAGGIVVAAGGRADPRRAPELRQPHDEGLVQ